MDNIAIESFIQHCDDMMIAEEGYRYTTYKKKVPLLGKQAEVTVYIYGGLDKTEVDKRIDNFIRSKTFEDQKIWDALYKKNKSYFEEINNDPYFNGKKIASPSDLKKSLEITAISVHKGSLHVKGEWWGDPEHGFSINFPKDNFVDPNNHTDWKNDYCEHGEKRELSHFGQYSDDL